MIKIDGNKIFITGSGNDLIDDIQTFIDLFTNNESISKIAFGEGFEKVSKIFTIDSLLRNIFTICGTNKDEFYNLLKSIEKITDECIDGEFILEYQEGEKDEIN